jgi:hypothetical protein
MIFPFFKKTITHSQDCSNKFATKRKTVVHTLRHHPIQAFLFSLFLAALAVLTFCENQRF